ncbi:MAG: PqqD family protein [Paludibacter sp.]
MMNIQELHNLKSKFVAREVGNELILVPLAENVAHMSELFTMNETAKFIWENSAENLSVADMENLMIDNFSIDNDTARKDIDTFLNQMQKLFNKNIG